MPKGDSKVTIIEGSGKRQYIDRTPAKKLNLFTKHTLLDTLKRDDINVEIAGLNGHIIYQIKDATNKTLFSCSDCWHDGYYSIHVGDFLVAEMDWAEEDAHTNADQQDIFDILDAVREKRREIFKKKKIEQNVLAAKKLLSPLELAALNKLRQR